MLLTHADQSDAAGWVLLHVGWTSTVGAWLMSNYDPRPRTIWMLGFVNRYDLLAEAKQANLLNARSKWLHRPCQMVGERNRVEPVGTPNSPHATATIALRDHSCRRHTWRREQRRHFIRLTGHDLRFGLVSQKSRLSTNARPQSPQAPRPAIPDPATPLSSRSCPTLRSTR